MDIDKYDASKNERNYLVWLVQTGQAEILGGNNNIHIQDPFSKKTSDDTKELTPEECLKGLQNGKDRYKFKCKFQGNTYDVNIPDADGYRYREDFGGLEQFFKQYVSNLQESGEYYIPETKIPKFEAPKEGTKAIKVDENQYIIANRDKVYSQLSGTPIFKDSFILTDDKSIVYNTGEKEKFSDMLYTKTKDVNHIENEAFIGYNENEIMFIQDQGKSYNRKSLSGKSIQKIKREDLEHPVSIFSSR